MPLKLVTQEVRTKVAIEKEYDERLKLEKLKIEKDKEKAEQVNIQKEVQKRKEGNK